MGFYIRSQPMLLLNKLFESKTKKEDNLEPEYLPELDDIDDEPELILRDDEDSQQTYLPIQNPMSLSDLSIMPYMFCRDYLVKRDSLFPGKNEISNFFIENVLRGKPFNLLLLNAQLDYYQASTWAEFYKEEVLRDINTHLRETDGTFLHLPVNNMPYPYQSGLIMRFNETAVEMLRDRILSVFKKVCLFDDENKEITLHNYQKFMSDMPKISLDFSDIPFEPYHINNGIWECLRKLKFHEYFSTFKLNLVSLTHDNDNAIDMSDPQLKYYASFSIEGKKQDTSHIFFDTHSFLREYCSDIEIAQ